MSQYVPQATRVAAVSLALLLHGCLAEDCTTADGARGIAPAREFQSAHGDVVFMSCNTPESILGPGMSGMPYSLSQVGEKTVDADGVHVQLKLAIPAGGDAAVFRAFVIKSAVGVFECLAPNTRFKNCTGETMIADAPGGEGIHQAITQVDDSQKTEATFTWLVPIGTTGIHRLTVVVAHISDWYGSSMAFNFNDAPSSTTPAATAAAATAEVTLGMDIASFSDATFVTEVASVLGIMSTRISVLEYRPGSVIVSFAIAADDSPGSQTPASLLTTLQSLVSDPNSAVYSSTTLLGTTTTSGLTVLSDGECTASGSATSAIEEECARCKSAGLVLLMLFFALLVAGSTVWLCMMRKLCGRHSRDTLDAKWEQECDGYDAKSGAPVITCLDLQEKVKRGENVYIIDTRGSDEHATSTIRAGGATAVLLEPKKVGPDMEWTCGGDDEIKQTIQPPADATIVCHCTAGYRSGFAANDLTKRLGREVLNLRGGIITWANQGDGERFAVVDPKTGASGAAVNTFGPKWGVYLHTPENKVFYKGYVTPDDTIKAGGLLKLFIAMSILMTVVLIFLLVDIPLAYEEFIDWIQDIGAWGPIVAGIAWIPVCLLFVPGLILSLSSGFAFDFAPAFASTLIGATIGCCFACVAGRYLGREWVEGLVQSWPKFKAIDAAISQEGWKIVFLLRLSPLIPFNLLNYFLGLTDVPIFPDYFLATFIGMAPGCAMFVYIGTTLGAVADVLKGNVDGGGDCLNAAGDKLKGFGKDTCTTGGHTWEETDTSVMRLILMIVGLAATIVATCFVTVIAKKKLDGYVDGADESAKKANYSEVHASPGAFKEEDPTETSTVLPFSAETQVQEGPVKELAQPIRLPPVAGWKTSGGCALGWLLLIGALTGLVLAFLHKEKVDFVQNDPGNSTVFITATNLKAMVDNPAVGVTILDARETNGDHIPGAQKADWKSFTPWTNSNKDSNLKPVSALQAMLREKGVSNEQQVVVYGDWANQGAWGEEGRLFWMLEYLNHTKVSVLYGGIDAYARDSPYGLGLELESSWGAPPGGTGTFSAFERVELRATRQEINTAITLKLCNVIFFDTRTQAEYDGSRSMYGADRDGHIPAAKWFPWQQVFDSDGGNIKSAAVLREELQAYSVTDSSMVIAYCTGGIRSGFLYMALRYAGFSTPQNYDGSWWEWSQNVYSMPIE